MAHFAIISKSNNAVVNVVTVQNDKLGNPESEEQGINHVKSVVGSWFPDVDYYFKQCSYNANGAKEKRFNYPGIGFTWDEQNGAFIAPNPSTEDVTYTLNENFQWATTDTSSQSSLRQAARPSSGSAPTAPETTLVSPEHQAFHENFTPTSLPKISWWKRAWNWLKSLIKK